MTVPQLHRPGNCSCRQCGCPEVLFAWFDLGNCDEEFPCYWWDQVLAGAFYIDGTSNYRTVISNQLLIAPLFDPPGDAACIRLNGSGQIEVFKAGYVHMLPNSGSATATINGNAAYTWNHYDLGDILACTYQDVTTGNPCLDCHGPDPIDGEFIKNDVVPPFNP